ncbi:MAG TPA: glycine/sarcosine/betaine reductase component B subunit, partial [Acidimicrobiales bacterium]|nr:glycine/sarcosine/betaine reductase component B subunit [Acidimicrobiales bacterium]
MEDDPVPATQQEEDGSAPGLARVVHLVEEVALGEAIAYEGRRLTVSADEAAAVVADPALARVSVRWVSPGQPVRVVKLLDAVEPRTKGRGGGGIFPGFVGPARAQGRADTHVLRGAAVVVAGYLPRAQEAVLDMSGPAAELSPLARTHNLVVEFTPADGAGWEAVEEALRRGALALATRLADAALDAAPDAVEQLPAMGAPGGSGLPRVAALANLQTQGAFKDVFVYGRSFATALPTLVDANELEDGAVVSGQYGHPGLKNPTFVHQNHPVVAALRSRHGRDLEFVGVVLSPEPVDQGRKELMAAHASRLCAAAGLDGLVVTKEGGGNADGDMSLKMDALEELGLTAVGLFAEMAGPDGTGPSLVVPPSRAAAMVSTGNYDERLTLPAVEEAVGGEQLALLGVPAGEEVALPTAVVYCSLSPLGAGLLTCQEATEVAEEAAPPGPGPDGGP